MSRKEKIQEYDALLQAHIDNKHYVKICRTICGNEDNLSGFILKMSKHFLLLQIEYDFLLDGYAIIGKDDFDSVRYNKFDRTIQKILHSEGLDSGYGINSDINLTSWADIFQSLKKSDYHVVIESDHKNENYLDFYIGEVNNLSKKSVYVHYYAPTGRLDEKPSKIKYDRIRIVKFGDRYSTTFRKYLKPPE